MKLSEIKTEGNAKLLLIGDPGDGKTVFSCSFPTPLLLLDFDGKADSAALFYRKDTQRLDDIDVRAYSANLVTDPIAELNKLIDTELIPQQTSGKLAYKTIVIDSVTTFSRAVLNHIILTNPGVKRTSSKQGLQPCLADYGVLKREFSKLIPGLLSLDCNIIFTAHMDTQKDELTGELIRGPLMDGAFSNQLSIYFKEVWRIYTDKNQRLAQTQSDYKYKCRSQIPGLPNPFDITKGYEALKQYIS